jgi:PadR family transcriptional regulator PadR
MGDEDEQLRESEEAAAAEWNRRKAELAKREAVPEADPVVRGSPASGLRAAYGRNVRVLCMLVAGCQPGGVDDACLTTASTNILLSIILAGMAAKPMTGQAFFVLTALAVGPRHGYGIVSDVAELSQGRVKLKIGSLYGVLERLAAEELIEPDREEAHDGRLRRYYRLTQDGRRALSEEAELRAATARVVRARLRLAGTEAAG